MITASQLRVGMGIRYENQAYRVLAADYHPDQGKMGGVNHVRLRNLATGTLWEHSFRAELKIEELEIKRRSLEFLYDDGEPMLLHGPGYLRSGRGAHDGHRRTGQVPGPGNASTGRSR